MTPLKLNRCKLRVGDKITALYIGNPQGENYVNSGIQTNIIKVADEKGNTYNLIDSFGHNNIYKNSVFTGGEIYNVGSQSYLIADWSLNKIFQRLVFGGDDSLNTNRNIVLYFTEPLKIVSAPTSNPNFDNDFQGIVAFTNTSRVNTGTFDPASDNPAGQKSSSDYFGAVLGDEIIRNAIATTWMYSYHEMGNIFAPRNIFQGVPKICSGRFGKDRFGANPFFSVKWDTNNWGVNLDRAFCYARITYFDFNDYLQTLMNNGPFSAVDTFRGAFDLEIIDSYDFKNCNNMNGFFDACQSAKHIHIKNFPVSFDISASTAFEESDLVEILNNLMDLTGKTSQTLTMGATNLAKLTDSDRAIATNKNWVLA